MGKLRNKHIKSLHAQAKQSEGGEHCNKEEEGEQRQQDRLHAEKQKSQATNQQKHKHPKPYAELTWEERKAKADREEQDAARVKIIDKWGRCRSPHNTNSFLFLDVSPTALGDPNGRDNVSPQETMLNEDIDQLLEQCQSSPLSSGKSSPPAAVATNGTSGSSYLVIPEQHPATSSTSPLQPNIELFQQVPLRIDSNNLMFNIPSMVSVPQSSPVASAVTPCASTTTFSPCTPAYSPPTLVTPTRGDGFSAEPNVYLDSTSGLLSASPPTNTMQESVEESEEDWSITSLEAEIAERASRIAIQEMELAVLQNRVLMIRAAKAGIRKRSLDQTTMHEIGGAGAYVSVNDTQLGEQPQHQQMSETHDEQREDKKPRHEQE